MAPATTIVAGIPIPSRDPAFLAIVAIHILFGIAAVLAGAMAMLSRKGSARHIKFGRAYVWSLSGVFATMTVLSTERWTEDYPLFVLGALSFGFALSGRVAIRRRHPRIHLTAMGLSYVLMLTAFYVDNGKNLPVWRDLPSLAYWVAPSAIGMPLILFYLRWLPKFASPENWAHRGGASR